jgi:hypothetical protein
MAKLFTLLDTVSQAALEIGISQTRVGTVVGSNDQDIVQMRSLLHAVAAEVLTDEPYQTTLGDEVWISSATGEPQDRFIADDDVILFDGRLAVQGLKWRFLKGKGLEFGEEMRDFTARLNKLSGRVNGRVLDLDEGQSDGRQRQAGNPRPQGNERPRRRLPRHRLQEAACEGREEGDDLFHQEAFRRRRWRPQAAQRGWPPDAPQEGSGADAAQHQRDPWRHPPRCRRHARQAGPFDAAASGADVDARFSSYAAACRPGGNTSRRRQHARHARPDDAAASRAE